MAASAIAMSSLSQAGELGGAGIDYSLRSAGGPVMNQRHLLARRERDPKRVLIATRYRRGAARTRYERSS